MKYVDTIILIRDLSTVCICNCQWSIEASLLALVVVTTTWAEMLGVWFEKLRNWAQRVRVMHPLQLTTKLHSLLQVWVIQVNLPLLCLPSQSELCMWILIGAFGRLRRALIQSQSRRSLGLTTRGAARHRHLLLRAE